jgi:acyl-coenzyme A synthetase/AMP-(fatty) acid ligase
MTTPLSSPADQNAVEFSQAPLLDAFENFEGLFFDIERNLRISASELKKLKTEFRRKMVDAGLMPGDRIVAALPNGPLFAAVWAASLEAGASPILVHGETPALELERMAQRWGGRFLVAEAGTSDGREQDPGELLMASAHGNLRWQRVGSEPSNRFQVRPASVPLHPTSGTSGQAKIAARPGRCAVAEPLHYIETLGLESSDVILCAIPMSHAYAYGMCLMVSLLTSAKLLFMRRFNPELVRAAVNELGVSILPAVPTMLDALLPSGAGRLTGRPRIVLSAGAPLPKKTFEAWRDNYQLCVRPLYGTTETGGISIAPAGDQFDGSVGPPMKGVEVDLQAISDTGFGAEMGVLRVRSSSMMAGCLEENGVSASALHDGWFETGDLARIDAHGKIHLQGRLAEVINAFGFKVVPREVEEVIALLPEIVEVKVYADRQTGGDAVEAAVEAAVVCHGRLSEEQILKHCEKHLVNYKCPTTIRFVESLPRTASGKVVLERLPR